jgi:ribosomal protein L2
LNLNNKGIAKTIQIIEYEKLDPKTIAEMKKAEAKKAMITIVENDGIKEGKQIREIEIAKNLIRLNIDKNIIQKSTGLTIEIIENLINEINNATNMQ